MNNPERFQQRHHGRSSAALEWVLTIAGIGAVAGILSATGDEDPRPRDEATPFAQLARHDHFSPIRSLAISPDDARLASATAEGEVWIADLAGDRRSSVRRGPMSSAESLAFSPDGQLLAIAGDGPVIRLHDLESGREVEPLRAAGGDYALHVAFSRDGRRVVAGVSGGVLTLWDWPGRRPTVLRDSRGGISALTFSPDGSLIAVGDSAGRITLRDATAGEEKMTLAGHGSGNAVTSLAFSPDGSTLATASFVGRTVLIWDLRPGGPPRPLPRMDSGVKALAYSPDGTLLALARGDGAVCFWGVAEGRERTSVGANRRPLEAVTFSGDGRTLATGGADGSVRLWDVARALAGGREARRSPGPSRRVDDGS